LPNLVIDTQLKASYDVASNIWQAVVMGLLAFHSLGRAVQFDPMKPTLKAPGSQRLKLRID
jgi:hypothetical protein